MFSSPTLDTVKSPACEASPSGSITEAFNPPYVPLGNTHTMVTWSKAKIFKPKVLSVEAVDFEPRTIEEALAHKEWKLAIQDEFDVLMANFT